MSITTMAAMSGQNALAAGNRTAQSRRERPGREAPLKSADGAVYLFNASGATMAAMSFSGPWPAENPPWPLPVLDVDWSGPIGHLAMSPIHRPHNDWEKPFSPKPAPVRAAKRPEPWRPWKTWWIVPKSEWLGFWPELFSRVLGGIIVLMLFLVLFTVGFGLAELLGWLP